MTENASTNAPLTRREARAIERRTGRRISTGSIAAVSLNLEPAPEGVVAPSFEHDTAEIKRNPDSSLVSVFPTEVIGRVADKMPATTNEAGDDLEGSAFARPISIRAARPAALVARTRRRTALGLGVAASAAVLATAVVAVPGGLGQQNQVGQDAAQASLVKPDEAGATEAQADTASQTAGATESVDLVAAPAAAPDRAEYAVTAFEPAEVAEVVEEVEAPAEDTSSDGGSTDTGSSDAGQGGGQAPPPADNGGGNHDTSSIAGIAQSMLGGGAGWACTDFTAAVYAQAGITLSGGVSSQAAGGTQTSNPQVGDLVVFSSGHIGIYAGGGMMWDNPGYASSYTGWQNVYRSMDVIGSSYYFVTYR